MNEPTSSTSKVAVVCDVTMAPDSVHARIEAYRRLFADALVGRERVGAAVRFRFRANDEIESRVRDLAALEQQCCAFFTFTINRTSTEILWDSTVIDGETAHAVLDEWFDLPETVVYGAVALHDRMTSAGLRFAADPLA